MQDQPTEKKSTRFHWALSVYTLAANKLSFDGARPCGTMNSLGGNRDDAFAQIFAFLWLMIKQTLSLIRGCFDECVTRANCQWVWNVMLLCFVALAINTS